MNSHVALYLVEVRQAELRRSAAGARAAASASTSWADRFRAAVVRRQRRPAAGVTLATPAASPASAMAPSRLTGV
jgi:hypothetical protein